MMNKFQNDIVALHAAAQGGHTDAIKYLIELGAQYEEEGWVSRHLIIWFGFICLYWLCCTCNASILLLFFGNATSDGYDTRTNGTCCPEWG